MVSHQSNHLLAHTVAHEAAHWASIPKVELHIHMEGLMRLNTILEECKRHNVELPIDVNDKKAVEQYFLMENPMKNLMEFIVKFDRLGVCLKDEQSIERMAYEAVMDKAAENVRLVEFRYAPSFIANIGKGGLTMLQAHGAVKRGLKKGQDEVAKTGDSIEVGLICIAVGAMGREDFEKTVAFCLETKGDWIGFDVAGAELNTIQWKDLMDKLHEAGINITIHAGEDLEVGTPENVRTAFEDLHAKRIGHGIQVWRDEAIYKKVKEQRVHLEVCPFSNFITGAVEHPSVHPVRRFIDEDVNLSISTDDAGVFGTDLNIEYALLSKFAQVTPAEFFKLNRNGVAASFLPESTKKSVMEKYFSPAAEAAYMSTPEAKLLAA